MARCDGADGLKVEDVSAIIYTDPAVTAADYGNQKLSEAIMFVARALVDLEDKVNKNRKKADEDIAALKADLKALTKRVEKIEKKLDMN